MEGEGQNNSFDENNLLNADVDPILPAVHVGGNGEQDELGNENSVSEQTSIQELVQRMNTLTQSLESRDAIFLRRLAALEQISSRGSQASTVSTAGSRPLNNRFGIAQDQNEGSYVLNGVSINGDSPAYTTAAAPSAAVPDPLGPTPDSRHPQQTIEKQ